MSETTEESVAPLVKTVIVPVDPTRAFELFTTHLDAWWPMATHSVGGADAESVTLQAGVGGQIVESLADGRTEVWGTVTQWAPPRLVAFSWHPGRSDGEATAVLVSFAGTGAGTRVELTHTGWEARPDSVASRRGYDSGWDVVLGCFEQHAVAGGTADD